MKRSSQILFYIVAAILFLFTSCAHLKTPGEYVTHEELEMILDNRVTPKPIPLADLEKLMEGSASSARAFTALTGEGTGALDKPACSSLSDGDQAWVQAPPDGETSGLTYFYVFNTPDTTAEAEPFYIRCSSWTSGVWHLSGIVVKELMYNSNPPSGACSGRTFDDYVDSNTVGFGGVLTLDSNGSYDDADADAESTAANAIACEAGTGTKRLMKSGYVSNSSWSFSSLGLPVYLSNTAGNLTQTQPTSGIVQIIGTAEDSDTIHFNPQEVFVVLE